MSLSQKKQCVLPLVRVHVHACVRVEHDISVYICVHALCSRQHSVIWFHRTLSLCLPEPGTGVCVCV